MGAGVMLFGAWSGIKALILCLFQQDRLLRMLGEEAAENPKLYLLATYIALAIFFAVDLLLRVYVGRAARAEGFGRRKRGYGYIIAAALLALGSFLSMAGSVAFLQDASQYYDSWLDVAVSFAVDATSAVVLAEVAIAGIRVKKLTRGGEKEDAGHAA